METKQFILLNLLYIRFYPSKGKAIGERVIQEELNGVTYEEEEAKIWSMNISDKIRDAVNGIFACQILL